MRFLAIDERAVFFDTTTAYPSTSFGKITLKLGDEMRLPLFAAMMNSERLSRFLRGNTVDFMRPDASYWRGGGLL